MKVYVLCLAVTLLSTLVIAQRIRYVGSKTISPIRSKLGGIYKNYRKYQPAIRVLNGCVPHPAVGRYTASAGLKIGGARNGQCGGSVGQVYARHKNFRKGKKRYRGIMYAYYFPKDQVFAGGASPGHRHDWEEVIIFTTWNWKRALKAAMSAHGGYSVSSRWWKGKHKKVLYANGNTIKGISHEFRDNKGKPTGSYRHPMANWYQLSKAVRYTLNNAAWLDQKGKQRATPKIIDSQFSKKMNEAFRKAF